MARKKAEEQEEEMETGESRVYELGFHLDPDLPTEEVKNAYQAIRSLIAAKGQIVAEGEPHKVALAYTISRQETTGRRDFDSAHFSWIAYEAPVEAHAEIVAAAGADKRIIRFIDLVTDKEAARAAAEREELAAKTPEPRNEAEGAAPVADDAALDAALESATA
jgi:ribosomal protein S6